MKNAELQVLSVNPTAGTNKIMLFANTGGYVLKKNSAGVELLVASDFSGVISQNSVATGLAQQVSTGTVFGSNFAGVQTGLGTPAIFLPIRYNNTIYALPAYALL